LVTEIDLNSVDLDSENGLLARLASVTDPRMPRGIRHSIVSILGIAAIGTLRGARSFRALGEIAAELPQEALVRLGARISPVTGLRVAPDSSTIRRNLNAIDRNEFDQVLGSWLSDQVAASRCKRREAESQELFGSDDDDETKDLYALAVDGKTLQGARLDNGGQVHLLSALTHDEGIVIAQRNVDGKTNEITEFCPAPRSRHHRHGHHC
ncbi:transposase tnpA, partial [mine drainage metagenome]